MTTVFSGTHERFRGAHDDPGFTVTDYVEHVRDDLGIGEIIQRSDITSLGEDGAIHRATVYLVRWLYRNGVPASTYTAVDLKDADSFQGIERHLRAIDDDRVVCGGEGCYCGPGECVLLDEVGVHAGDPSCPCDKAGCPCTATGNDVR